MQPWTHDLPLREQGTLVAGLRGCDLTPKNPVDSTARQLVAYLRWLTMVPADAREVDLEPGTYMQSSPPPAGWRQSELGHLPLHYVSHLMHAYQVVAYRHPDDARRLDAFFVYVTLVEGLHLVTEPRDVMIARLSEDRIASGRVVS
jgi:hypothetical protein